MKLFSKQKKIKKTFLIDSCFSFRFPPSEQNFKQLKILFPEGKRSPFKDKCKTSQLCRFKILFARKQLFEFNQEYSRCNRHCTSWRSRREFETSFAFREEQKNRSLIFTPFLLQYSKGQPFEIHVQIALFVDLLLEWLHVRFRTFTTHAD